MSYFNAHPLAAIGVEFDARSWSGSNLYNRGGAFVAFPTFTPNTTEGIYQDLIDLLNGFGSPAGTDLNKEAQNLWLTISGAPGTFGMGIASTSGKLAFVSTLTAWSISANANNAFWGLPTAGVGPIAPGVVYEAPDDFSRGNFNDKWITITPTAFPGFSVPAQPKKIQNMVVAQREVSVVADADDMNPLTNLEYLDNAIYSPVNKVIRWGLTDDGYVYYSVPTGSGIGAIAWASTTFRDALGFSGNETVDNTTINNVDLWVADYRSPYFYLPSRPLINQVRTQTQVTATARATDGRWGSNNVGSYGEWEIEFYVDGPIDSEDQHRHFLDKFLPVLTHGKRCNLYQEWGDTRRAKFLPNDGKFSELWNPTANGYRGRLLLRLHPDSGDSYTVSWPQQLRRRAPFSLKFSDFEGGQEGT
jgi:hypothetical protein